jgi:hypothetical protein
LTLFTSSETPLPFYFEKKKQPGKDEELCREKMRERERKIIQGRRYSSGCVDMNKECP